VFILTG